MANSKDLHKKSDEIQTLHNITSRIKTLTKEGRFDEALTLCNDPKISKNVVIQSQKVKVLLLMYNENSNQELLNVALAVCEENAGNQVFDFQKEKIKMHLITPNDTQEIKNIQIPTNEQLTKLLTNIYSGTITNEEIENSDIDAWEKTLLLLAYYDKNNKKNGVSYLKSIKKLYEEVPEKKKVLNLLGERLLSRSNRIFDASIYSKYLNCTIDPNFIKTAKSEVEPVVKKSTTQKVATINTDNVINESIKNDYKTLETSEKLVDRVTFNGNNCPTNSVDEQKNPQSSDKLIYQKCIKDLFPQEVSEIEMYLYIQMNNIERQRAAAKAWDNFECLINKPSNDKKALIRMFSLLEKFRVSGLLFCTEKEHNNKIFEKKRNNLI